MITYRQNRPKSIIYLIILLGGLLLTGSLIAGSVFKVSMASARGPAIFYVDNVSGNDANNGTSSTSPWQSINKINGSSFVAGDQILLKRGDTWSGQGLNVPNSGLAGNPIIFDAYSTGNNPLITQVSGNGIVISNKSWLIVRNINVSHSSSFGIVLQGGSANNILDTVDSGFNGDWGIWIEDNGTTNNQVNNSSSHDNPNGGMQFNPGANNNTVTGGVYYNNTGQYASGVEFDSSGNLATGVVSHNNYYGLKMYGGGGTESNTQNNRFYRNTAYSNSDFGFDVDFTGLGNLVENNVSYNNGTHGISIEGTTNGTIVRYNLVHNNGSGLGGIELDGTTNVKIYYNVIYGEGNGIWLLGGGNTSSPQNVTIYNNTIYNSSNCIAVTSNAVNVTLKNNITSSCGTAVSVESGSTQGFVSNNNDWFVNGASNLQWGNSNYNLAGWKSATSQDANSVDSDPRFINPGSANFQLNSNSPAINTGANIGLSLDFNGASVPQGSAPDMGAYEFGGVVSSTPAPIPTATPSFTPTPIPTPAPTPTTSNTPSTFIPVINSFAASPAVIATGGSTTLSWSVTNAGTVTISPNVGTVSASGSTAVTLGQNTTYVLTITNGLGTISKSLLVVVSSSASVIPVPTPAPTSIPSGSVPQLSHVVIVLEENTDYSSVIGNSSMPYFNSLANTYALATNYHANTHPSIGNYLMLATGQILTNDDNQDPSTFPVSVDNVVRHLIAAGKTWKSYAEDLPSAGYIGGDSGNYAVRHNPFPYLTDVQNSTAQEQNLVPFTQFSTDLANNNLPAYSFIVPNLCNDAHDCSTQTADNWLKTNIDPLVKNSSFMQNGLLIITFDEDAGGGGNKVPWIAVGNQVKHGYQSGTNFVSHAATLRLSMQTLGLSGFPGAAASALDMGEFFTGTSAIPTPTPAPIPMPSPGVSPPPIITSLNAAPNVVGSSNLVNLSWVSSNATALSISPTVGNISGATGNINVNPTQTTIYTLTVTNNLGSVANQVMALVTSVTSTPTPIPTPIPSVIPTPTALPVISNISVTNIGQFSADINWATNMPTDGQVVFLNPCPSSGCSTPIVTSLSTNHIINIFNLSPAITYPFNIKSKNASNNLVTSSLVSFTTILNTPTPTPIPSNTPIPTLSKTPTPIPIPTPATTPTPITNPNSQFDGWLDVISQKGEVIGWAIDANNPSTPIPVSFYIDNTPGSGGSPVATIATNAFRQDVNDLFTNATGNHGFDWYMPVQYQDGHSHTMYIYADSSNVPVFLVKLTPQSFTLGSVLAPTPMSTPIPTPPIVCPFACIVGDSCVNGVCVPTATVTPTPSVPSNFTGYLNYVNPDGTVGGWAADYNNPATSIPVSFYIDSTAGHGGAVVTILTANLRTDVNQLLNTFGNHGFTWIIPAQYQDGKNHTLYIYADDSNNTPTFLLNLTPVVFNFGSSSVTPGISQTPVPSSVVNGPFTGKYYRLTSTRKFGSLIFSRPDQAINFDWTGTSPSPNLRSTFYAVRWTNTLSFSASGRHTFTATTDDGMRIWIDGVLVLNKWFDQKKNTYNFSRQLSAGNHSIRVDYYQATGAAAAQVLWN
jgi:hypothetical protein